MTVAGQASPSIVKTWQVYLGLTVIIAQLLIIVGQSLWDLGGLDEWRHGVDLDLGKTPPAVRTQLATIETRVANMSDAITRVENSVGDLTRALILRGIARDPERYGRSSPDLRPEMRPRLHPGNYIDDVPPTFPERRDD